MLLWSAYAEMWRAEAAVAVVVVPALLLLLVTSAPLVAPRTGEPFWLLASVSHPRYAASLVSWPVLVVAWSPLDPLKALLSAVCRTAHAADLRRDPA